MSRRATIPVYCDEESHGETSAGERRVATVGHLPYSVADDRPNHVEHRESPDAEMLVGDRLLAPRGVNEYDSSDNVEPFSIRNRHVFECDLCGLRAELRDETERKLTAGLVEAGVSSLRLSDLVASL